MNDLRELRNADRDHKLGLHGSCTAQVCIDRHTLLNEIDRLTAQNHRWATTLARGLWQALLDECREMEKWHLPDRVGVNAWVGVDTFTGLYGAVSFDGEPEDDIGQVDGDTPEAIILELISRMREWRERIDRERAEDETP